MTKEGYKKELEDGSANIYKAYSRFDENLQNEFLYEIETGASVFFAASKVGIHPNTHNAKKIKDPEYRERFLEAKQRWKENSVKIIRDSLAKRATGYEFQEIQSEYVAGADNRPILVKQKKVKKTVAPDTAACIFMLTNLDPENWKNRQNTEANVAITTPNISFARDDSNEIKLAKSESEIENNL